MRPSKFIGKTLGELAGQTGVFWKPVHVFVLKDKDDDTGVRLMDAYSLKQVIASFPATAHATVVSARELCDETYIVLDA